MVPRNCCLAHIAAIPSITSSNTYMNCGIDEYVIAWMEMELNTWGTDWSVAQEISMCSSSATVIMYHYIPVSTALPSPSHRLYYQSFSTAAHMNVFFQPTEKHRYEQQVYDSQHWKLTAKNPHTEQALKWPGSGTGCWAVENKHKQSLALCNYPN